MYKCFVCKSTFVSIQKLIHHLKLSHSFYPGKTIQLMCDQNGCCQRCSTFSGFRKHLHSKHTTENLYQVDIRPVTHLVDVSDQQMASNFIPDQPENSQSCIETRQHTQEMCASLTAKLQGCGVATTVIKTVVENMEELVEELHSNVKEDVVKLLPNDEDMRRNFDSYFESLDDPFSELKSETKWKKIFCEKWGTVEPVEIALGVRYDVRRNGTTGMYNQVPITDDLFYIPLLETLKFIFTNQEICNHFVQPCEETGIYKDFCDGNYFRNHPLFSVKPNSLQIQIFYDDFETGNPLGSKHGIHKVGRVYFVLRNLSPKIHSALMNIHLLALFHTEDVKKYGFNAILEPFVHDLKILECTGIEVPFSDEPFMEQLHK
ncbi:uncharacterized protein LOC110946095 [Acanthochromis polyacanthus]|uniref:uncharacterized protein LOC110946095 n=1 Tax=Acanthochromis polyacanthus TaxID=80966 RepID=UPI000B9066D0|nr:uncharacterized protein LOC110946095 [Acanthochromis polyacanthus]XP_022043365.1 uncharacterized protein LOC110946095 [Acanthochromis polyacanthus]XP_051811866.1 uncharacterized protein LOC110946095 [Acanthochromis polyacanthus]XP_051811867.1 uncharacterized protein LOC110946095 [Acanthochromis polyacanthus]